ncbi:hypothetical protein BN1080_02787 [Planococcus massiliensis]|uniref:DUF2812 domain-containing protein n=1 Tax=Planococcus massiliensis TaxID=1499687 RepID=A0A098EPS8_9BACL|nr:DUF2812 domain-containing protein [Planococcus massiliensis]CEG23782.1 hypothetical protein BN1080_02787 [Planococcus massiliensis]
MKKFNFTLAYDIEKEAKWLTDMSAKGFHFYKYRWGFYYFEENPSKSYIYQTDFQEASDEYFELYQEAGWEHIQTEIGQYHYFRADKNSIGDQRIYSEPASIKGMYKRMLVFYAVIFLCLVVSQIGILLTWNGNLLSTSVAIFAGAVILLYIYLFIKLLRQMRRYEKLI